MCWYTIRTRSVHYVYTICTPLLREIYRLMSGVGVALGRVLPGCLLCTAIAEIVRKLR